MKKLFPKLSIFILVLMLTLTLVACNGVGSGSSTDKDQLPSAIYTVTFDSNGGTDFSSYNTKVNYGGKIAKPDATPTKTGYTFKWWSKSGGNDDEFVFSETIKSNITLKAVYTPKIYEHDVTIYEDKYAGNFDENNYVYKVYGDSTTPEFPVKSEYDQLNNLPIAVSLQKGGTGTVYNTNDYFVYWYYLENGKEVRFSTWATKPVDTTSVFEVKELKKYTKNAPVALFAKWHSCLPSVNLVFENVPTDYNPDYNIKYNDNLKNLPAPEKANYSFNGWLYTIENSDGTTSQADLNTEQALTEEILKEDGENFKLTLTAKWKREIKLYTPEEYSTKLYTPVIDLYSQIESTTDQATLKTLKAQLDEYLKASITLLSDLDFTGHTFVPLFTQEYPFQGTIDGTKDSTAKTRFVIKGARIEGYDSVSLLGYVAGKISNVDFKDIRFTFIQKDGAYAPTAYVSPIATALSRGGMIENCNVNYSADLNITFNNEIIFGGLSASSVATKIYNCSVTFTNLNVNATKAAVGGVVGKCQYAYGTIDSGNIDKCTVIGNISVTVPTQSQNNIVNLGGIAGELIGGACVSRTSYSGNLQANGNTVSVGGIAGDAIGQISNCHTTANISVNEVTKIANVGGIAGKVDYKESNIAIGVNKSYAGAGTINVNVKGDAKAYIGGIIGYCYKGKITNSFSLISLLDVKVYDANDTLKSLDDAAKQAIIGYVFAKSELVNNTSTTTKGYYEETVSIKLNNIAYEYTVEGTTGKENFAIDRAGDYKTAENIMLVNFYKSTLGLNDSIWELQDGKLPTLKTI